MLIMFRVNNFMSFRDDAILDLRKTSYREHEDDHIMSIEEHKLLKTISIFGANASGKSNLISSIAVFRDIVRNNFFEDETEDNDDTLIEYGFPIKPFQLSDKVSNSIEFEIVFHTTNLYQYGFSINEGNIESEWLLVDKELVFERNLEQIEYGEKYEPILSSYKKFSRTRLYIGTLDYFSTDSEIIELLKPFKEYFNSRLMIYLEIILESTIKGRVFGTRISKKMESDDKFRQKVVKYLRQIDIGISDIIIDEEYRKSSTGEEKLVPVIKTVHSIYNAEGNCVGEKTMDLRYESSGTLRFLSFIQEILLIMEKGGVFVVDELSSRLHPILTKFIVDLFQSKENTNTQLVFSTHDTTLMNKNQFRRDEIVLIDKSFDGASKIYSLSDLDVRKDATYDKEYFNGKYGAIPIIKSYGILDGDCNGKN